MHLLRLNIRKARSFWCPIKKFSLAVGYRLEATIPLGVDLRYILNGLRTGVLIDVNGTIYKKGEDNESKSRQETSGDVQKRSPKPQSADPNNTPEQSTTKIDNKEEINIESPVEEPSIEELPVEEILHEEIVTEDLIIEETIAEEPVIEETVIKETVIKEPVNLPEEPKTKEKPKTRGRKKK